MPTYTFCTIITAEYLPLAKALHASLKKYDEDCRLQILIIENENAEADQPDILYPSDIIDRNFFREIQKKYAHTNKDVFRWALKPILIGHLLDSGYDKVIFADPDLFFTGEYSWMLQLLDTYSVILTPHWADLDVIKSEDSVLSVLRNGLFNAGFVAASRKGLAAINWWAGMCHYKMERRQELGIYDDQKYLDILPVQFDDVLILKHQGCNLASWNIQTCKRKIVNNKLLINNKFDPVFIHFARDTITNILNRNDVLLKPYLDEYIYLLHDNGFDLLKNTDNYFQDKYSSSIYKIKHKLRLRTRLKRFLFKLAEKL